MNGWMESILQEDPISSHFSGNECVYRKELFLRYHMYNHTRSQARDLRPTHRKQTVGLRCMQSKLSRRKLILFNFDGQMLHRLLLQIRPVTEKRHSTGTYPANMPLIKQYVQQVAVTFLICSITFPKQKWIGIIFCY